MEASKRITFKCPSCGQIHEADVKIDARILITLNRDFSEDTKLIIKDVQIIPAN